MNTLSKKLITIASLATIGTVSVISYCVSAKKRTSTSKSCNKDMLFLNWQCPACGSKFQLDSTKTSKIKKCPNCKAEVSLCTERLRTFVKSQPVDGHNCVNCKHYINKPKNLYFHYGAGTCELDHSEVKLKKEPMSRCHNGEFERK